MFYIFFFKVEWSAEGKSVAVARMNVISILSAKFEEQISITLSFSSWISDIGESHHVKGLHHLFTCVLCLNLLLSHLGVIDTSFPARRTNFNLSIYSLWS